jgi:hypothetical protein
MASSSLIPKNGAVVAGVLVMDFASFHLRATNSVEDVTPYGSNVMAKRVSAATPGLDVTIAGFLLQHAANTAPTICSGTGVFAGGGIAVTLTLDTSVTYAGNLAVGSFDIQHARMRAAVPALLAGQSANDWTETWVVV